MKELTQERRRAAEVEQAALALMETLGNYPARIWGDALAECVAAVFAAKIDAADIEAEEKARRTIQE